METKALLIAALALVIGLGGGYALAMPSEDEHMMSNDMMHNSSMGMQGTMNGMMAALEGKTGDEFDKAFLSEMIMHHQGAVDMAEAALQNAKHEEIKTMAHAIVSAQTTEIKQMEAWQKNWYGED